MVNGTDLETQDLPDVTVGSGTATGVLKITNLSEIFNGTEIQCRSGKLLSGLSQIRLQGSLSLFSWF